MVIIGSASAVAAYLNALRGHFHTKAALLLGIAGVLLIVGAFMFSNRADALTPSTRRPVRSLLIDAVVGLLTGFLGVGGGGSLIVPALVFFAGIPAKQAIGTSLAIISLNSAAGLVGQSRYAQFDRSLTLAFTGLALVGMLAGLSLGDHLSETKLRRAFASLLIVIAVTVGSRNL